jgi:Receptor family ligand binding region/7 transmembrane sweet-taste receptor of 3 GCPR
MFLRTKVSTFANSDTYGSSGMKQFQIRAATMGVQILSSSLFPVGLTNFAGPISDALKSGSRVFVFFMSAIDMRNLLIQGTAAGLFGEGRQIIASDAAVTGAWVNIPRSQVSSMMKGVIAFSPSPNYHTAEGSAFLKSFVHQANTVKEPLTGLCNNRTDDDGNYLFRSDVSSDPSRMNCTGLNFSQYHSDGSNIDNYASYTYDATYAIARAMHVVLYDQKRPSITGKDLYSALINNVSFSGATGIVSFSKALSTDIERFGEGDRRTGITYSILNFSPRAYEADPSGISGFVTVGQWTVEDGNIFTTPVIYNTIDNSIPTDLPPDIILTMAPLHAKIMQCSALILLSSCAIFLVILISHRRYRLVKSVQLKMQCIMLIGALCGGARVLTGISPVTDYNCSTTMWLSHISFWMIFSPMMLKTWRVHRIVNNKTLKYVTVTEYFILRILGVIMLFILSLLTISQAMSVTTPVKVTVKTQIGVQGYLDDQCSRGSFGKSICYLVYI